LKKLDYAIDEFLEYKNRAEDGNTVNFYELALKEILYLTHDIQFIEMNHVTYVIIAGRLRIASKGDKEVFQINMFVLNQFVTWLFDEGYTEFDLAYSYRLLIN
jgi:hypothetical protein